MSKTDILEELLQVFSPSKFLYQSLKQYLTYEFFFLCNSPSYNVSKFNDHSFIYLHSIENYFNFPMIFTKCLFHALDTCKLNHITLDNYVSGFFTIYCGSLDERIRFIFHLFNINNDMFVHIEDIKCILGYIHIYNNKSNLHSLYHIIDDFFDNQIILSEEDFIHKTYSKNSGLLFIVLSIFREYQMFNNDILAFMDENSGTNDKCGSLSPINNKSGVNVFIKKISSKFKNCSMYANKHNVNKGTTLSILTNTNNNFTTTCCNNAQAFRKYLTNINVCQYKDNVITERYKHYVQCPPSQEVIDYIQSNYNIEFKYMWTHSTTFIEDPLIKDANINNSTFIKDSANSLVVNDSFASFYSDNEDGMIIAQGMKRIKQTQRVFISTNVWNCEMEKDFCDLERFEEEVMQTKYHMFEKCFPQKYTIPKGSNDFVLKSGVFGSSEGSRGSLFKQSLILNKSMNVSLLYQNSIQTCTCTNSIDHGNNCPCTTTNNNNNTSNIFPSKFSYMISNNKNTLMIPSNNNKQTQSLSSLLLGDTPNGFINKRNNSNGSYNMNTSFSDYYMHSSFAVGNELFEEEIYVITKHSSTKTKKYNLVLFKNLLLISKKKREPELKSYLEATMNQNTFSGLKFFIPLKRLYVNDASYSVTCNNIQYHQLSLVSTIDYQHRYFFFLFENKSSLVALVNLICSQTNYTSLSKVYSYIKDIGKGSFCQMKLMSHNKTNKLYAVKQISKHFHTPEEFTSVNWERDISLFLKNYPNLANILHIYDIIETSEHIYIIMEYIQSGSLARYLNRVKHKLPAITVKEILTQLALGICELHKVGIMHRDLKMENILIDYTVIDKLNVKIIDFGLSQVLTPFAKTRESYGTLIYCPPEVLLNFSYTNKIDVWSLGIIGYYLLYAVMPFDIKGNENSQEISNKIIINDAVFIKMGYIKGREIDLNVRGLLVKVIQRCLDKNVTKRPSIHDVVKLLME